MNVLVVDDNEIVADKSGFFCWDATAIVPSWPTMAKARSLVPAQ
jgi:hypothetical protein